MAMRTDVRIVVRDGTADGVTIWEAADVGNMPIPTEYTLLRVSSEEGMFMVAEQGVMHYFTEQRCGITITVDPVVIEDDSDAD